MIQTVIGRISPQKLGFCQSHEHILLSKGTSWNVNPALCLDDEEKSLQELLAYRAAGGGAIVEAQPVGCNRVADGLAALSRKSGVHIIASTGFHKICFYPKEHWIHSLSIEDLASIFTAELTTGMFVSCDNNMPIEKINACAGIIKTALDSGAMTPLYHKLFRAAALAQLATGAPFMVHIEKGADPASLLALLLAWGVAPERIIFCHMDRACPDLSVHTQLLSKGIYFEFDTIGRFKYHSDAYEIHLFQTLIHQGYENRLLFSLDTTRERLKSYTPQGIGLTYIREVFLPAMQEAGIADCVIAKISGENCQRVLDFCP